ncbi:tRNA pseudouridine(55) synthase TruB [Luteolibacter sp. Populi]|uniref:tRNA pseudouridine(55) synthase TruB n=1 Tax=Luteolibacter sp. Populi TaxID=3230487 RepID=UPI00346634A4
MNRPNSGPPVASGVLLVDKAPDMTSHNVVAIARRALGTKKIGHCGTLDPMATGLLMLVIERATKIQDLLMSEEKEYEGTLTLGKTTSTQDRQGEVLEEKEVAAFTPAEIDAAFASFTGAFEQLPPMVSAIKKDGVPLYKLARKGQEVERALRPVTVMKYEVRRIELPEVDFVVNCSKGFYVRTYAHDIGAKLGCGAHLSALRRTRSGRFTLERAVTVDQLKNAPREDLWRSLVSLAEISLMRGA